MSRDRALACVRVAGTLLTVDEAAQWVLHAAQLPQEVADAFVNNMVTGYDFPELAARGVSGEREGAGALVSAYFKGGAENGSRRRRRCAGLPFLPSTSYNECCSRLVDVVMGRGFRRIVLVSWFFARQHPSFSSGWERSRARLLSGRRLFSEPCPSPSQL